MCIIEDYSIIKNGQKISQIRFRVACSDFKSDVRILNRIEVGVGCPDFKSDRSRIFGVGCQTQI